MTNLLLRNKSRGAGNRGISRGNIGVAAVIGGIQNSRVLRDVFLPDACHLHTCKEHDDLKADIDNFL